MYKKIFMVVTALFFAGNSWASNADVQKRQCYTFKQNSNVVVNKGECAVEGGFGAGGSWLSITFKGKDYNFETLEGQENNGQSYIRHARTFKILDQKKLDAKTPILLCKKSKPYDICYSE
ncbi:hypothetical protein LP092_15395 (plasmid) [Moraxella bovis]|uniref:Uncharacterized protein n=1 Tax=Moraxella bovis TaxID=476 RepID=A0ABY6MAZ1_MORBO|nr:hypothetical protein [Moraxella bovis]UZA04751.1 hypothetical protein LP092_15395 [Moraxella bovis]